MAIDPDRLTPQQRRQAEQLFAQLDVLPSDSIDEAITNAECDEPVRDVARRRYSSMQVTLEDASQADFGQTTADSRPARDTASLKKVGRYTIKRLIGTGGMGQVFEAMQEHPRRSVALKVMRAAIASEAARRRFEYEVQILGRLRHPNIAQIYDAGVWDERGEEVPYFVMEYVPNKPIDVYVKDRQLDIRERLELFHQVCEAISHGHERGIIHRDLKPGNILIDGSGHAKVIDFGVARATDSDLRATAMHTVAGQLVGTLQYMSPEQCVADPNDIDIRTDVYALGVVLFELLADRLPYDIGEGGIPDAVRAIREDTPTRLTTFNSAIPRDVEVIVGKALEKERDRRYRSAGDLGDDIQRFLDDEAILARPPSLSEHIRRYARKNRAATVATVVVALAFIAAATISVLFGVEAQKQRDVAAEQRDVAETARMEADAQRETAERASQEAEMQRRLADEKTAEVEEKADELQAVVDFQAKQLSGIDMPAMGQSLRSAMIEELELEPGAAAGADFAGSALLLLNEHVFDQTLEAINKEFQDQPLVQAQLLQTMAWTMTSLGLLQEAMAPQVRALEIRTELLGREHPTTLESIHRMGDLLQRLGKYDEAMPYFVEALESRRRILGGESNDTLHSIGAMGTVLVNQRRFDEAYPYYMECLDKRRRLLGDEHDDTLWVINNLGTLMLYQGKLDEALPYFTEALATRRRVLGDEHPSTVASINNMGTLSFNQGKYDEALWYFTEALDALRRNNGDEHPDTLLTIGNVGAVLAAQGKTEEAMSYSLEVLKARRRVLGNEHRDTLRSIQQVGNLLYKQRKYDEAIAYFTEAIDVQRKVLGVDHRDTLRSISAMGFLHWKKGTYDDARPYFAEALQRQRAVLGDEHKDTMKSIRGMGRLLLDQGEYEQARPYLEESLAFRTRTLGASHRFTIESLEAMIELHDAWHEVDPDGGHDVQAAEYRAILEPVASN